MPLFEYICDKCGNREEHLVKAKEKDDELRCESCDEGAMMRRLLAKIQIGKPVYQVQAVLGSGAHVKGHFGKDAKRDKSGRKK